jgi:hypothetical protein
MIRRHLDWVATARGCQRSGPWVFSQTVCRVVNTPLVRRYDRQQHDEPAIKELRCCWPSAQAHGRRTTWLDPSRPWSAHQRSQAKSTTALSGSTGSNPLDA